MKLIFATHNQHKLEEVKTMLASTPFDIVGLTEMDYHDEIIEDGTTLEQNATIKSETIFKKYNIDVFSDDSGLEVEALDMAPGVYTARYAGVQKNAHDNMDKVLQNLQGISNRKARFRAVVSLIIDGKEHQFEGIVNGTIAHQKSGKEGFGYDPIFIPEGHDVTFAELPAQVKNEISHRGRAIAKLCDFLRNYR